MAQERPSISVSYPAVVPTPLMGSMHLTAPNTPINFYFFEIAIADGGRVVKIASSGDGAAAIRSLTGEMIRQD